MSRRAGVVMLLSVLAAGPVAAQENRLATARDLYASARYDEALALLDLLKPTDASNLVERRVVAQYRSLCLLALGRGDDAENAIAAVVTADPEYLPNEADASPRVRAAFSDVRRRMLPEIAAARYAEAKALYDGKSWAPAEDKFREVLALIDDPDMGGRLGDLRVLVTGFLELSVAAAAPPPPPPAPVAPPVSAPEPAPVAAAPPPATPPAAPMTAAAPAASNSAPMPANDETGMVPPQVISQDVPKVPMNILDRCQDRGLVEVTIDEQGRVMAVAIRASIHPTYDAMLLDAAKNWRYRPAKLNGQPAVFHKVIQVSVTR